MNKIIDEIAKLIVENGLSCKNEIVGCSIEEIQKLERFYGIKLPEVYLDFLTIMGKSAGNFMIGTDMFYKHLFDLREWAIELLQESDSDYKLPSEMFVFSMHQGYEFCCFDVNTLYDPKVYQYIESAKEPTVVWDGFSIYLNDMLKKHLS